MSVASHEMIEITTDAHARERLAVQVAPLRGHEVGFDVRLIASEIDQDVADVVDGGRGLFRCSTACEVRERRRLVAFETAVIVGGVVVKRGFEQCGIATIDATA